MAVEMYAGDMDVGVTELRANLSDWLQKVREGEEVTITDRGLAVARLVPVGEADLIERLTREGVLGRPVSAVRRKAADIKKFDLGVSVTEILIRQRGGDE